jgi:hypothetical protein
MLESLIHSLFNDHTESRPLSLSFLHAPEQTTPPDQAHSLNDINSLIEGHALQPCSNPAALYLTPPNDLACELSLFTPRLLQIYMEQVDPIFPLLQCPSLWAHLTQGWPYLKYIPEHPAPKALAYAIGYMAVATIDNTQCCLEFDMTRDVLLGKLHHQTQQALEEADYVNSDHVTVLQAFVLFLVRTMTYFTLVLYQVTSLTRPCLGIDPSTRSESKGMDNAKFGATDCSIALT